MTSIERYYLEPFGDGCYVRWTTVRGELHFVVRGSIADMNSRRVETLWVSKDCVIYLIGDRRPKLERIHIYNCIKSSLFIPVGSFMDIKPADDASMQKLCPLRPLRSDGFSVGANTEPSIIETDPEEYIVCRTNKRYCQEWVIRIIDSQCVNERLLARPATSYVIQMVYPHFAPYFSYVDDKIHLSLPESWFRTKLEAYRG